MKAHWGVEVDGGEWSTPGTDWIGGLVDPSRSGRCGEDRNLAQPVIEAGPSSP
jgi:hypothetical protein